MTEQYGWQGKILRIDLSSGEVEPFPIEGLQQRFVGGRGVVEKIYFDEHDEKIDALHPDSPMIVMSGPLAGTPAMAGSRWMIGGKSPFLYPDQFGLCNFGGSFAVKMKAAGIDGMIIRGKAAKLSYLHITDGKVTVEDATGLKGLNPSDTMARLQSRHGKRAKAVCIGQAGENLVRFATAMSDLGSSGGSGFGAVMGSKNLKAMVAEGTGKIKVARPDDLKQINSEIRSLTEGRFVVDPVVDGIECVKRTYCPGCQIGCARGLYKHESGAEGYRKNCQSAYMYYVWDQLYHDGDSTKNVFLATQLCNEFGLCTQELRNIFTWLHDCEKSGVLSDQGTGIPITKIGSMDFVETLVDKIVSRDGIGDVLAEGTLRAAQSIGKGALECAESILTKNGLLATTYCGRYFIVNSVFHATQSTSPLNEFHQTVFPMMKWVMWMATDGGMSVFNTEVMQNIAQKFWGNKEALDFSSYGGKAELANIIQNREFAKENLVVCDLFFPLMTAEGTEDHVGDPTLESRMLSAVTGIEYTEEAYYQTGEKTFNLQRAIQTLEGREGRKDDVLNEMNFKEPIETDDAFFGLFNPEFMLPGPGGELISRKGAVVEKDEFEKMMDEYYSIRGWDVESGLQKTETLEKLDLPEVISKLKKSNLIK